MAAWLTSVPTCVTLHAMRGVSITVVFRLPRGSDKNDPSSRGQWFVYVRSPHARDQQVKVEGATKLADRPIAEREAERMRKRLRQLKSSPLGETCDDYFDRYNEAQREGGSTDAEKKAQRWRKWISPRIGAKALASVTKHDVEDVRDALDAAVAAWTPGAASKIGKAVSGKTAMSLWTALTSTFKSATASKDRKLRVLDGKPNPCVGVAPPGDKRTRKARRKTFLYPSEAIALLSHEDVPLEWREVYAIAIYTYLRPGELRALRWRDIDLAVKRVHVSRSFDYQDNVEKEIPKTDAGVRTVPIEDALVPLLDRMSKGRERDEHVVPALVNQGEDHLAQLFRKHLTAAGVRVVRCTPRRQRMCSRISDRVATPESRGSRSPA